ncbi:MAG: RNA-directed DNA polymerase [Kineosporiaceae bacterium]
MAFRRLQVNGGDPDLPDVIGLADYRLGWTTVQPRVVQQILGAEYQPGLVRIIDLPKDELNVRPLARLDVIDRLVFESSVFGMASFIDRTLPSSVYSYRWSRSKQSLYAPTSRWMAMQKRGRSLHRKYPLRLLAKTDVTSFYEYVDIDILEDDLGGVNVPEWARISTLRFLKAFSQRSEAWGLPQGSDASGVLANLYLLPVDHLISKLGLAHLRYSDDLMVLGRSWPQLRGALIDVNRQLRSRHLSTSSGKTKIIEPGDILRELEDTEKDAIRYGIEISSPGSAERLRDLFDRAVSSLPVNGRDLRFALNQMCITGDGHAIPWLMSHLDKVPHMIRDVLKYFECMTETGRDMSTFLAECIGKRSLRLYPYAERHIVSSLIRLGSTATAKSHCWDIVHDRNEEELLREFCARLVGQRLAPGEGANLRRLFENEPSVDVRRALLVAMYEGAAASDRWLTAVGGSSPELRLVCEYLLSHPQEIPDPKLGKR